MIADSMYIVPLAKVHVRNCAGYRLSPLAVECRVVEVQLAFVAQKCCLLQEE